MNKQIAASPPIIASIKGRAVTSSLSIANYFHKQHKDVIRKIESLTCSSDFTERNFTLSEYMDSTGRKLPMYEITRDGFAFMGMGFTGAKAAAFKEAYIDAFNRMESALLVQTPVQLSNVDNCRVLHTYDKNGVIIHSRVAKDDEQLTSPGNFAEAMKKRGYVMVRTEDFKSLTIC